MLANWVLEYKATVHVSILNSSEGVWVSGVERLPVLVFTTVINNSQSCDPFYQAIACRSWQ